MTGVSLQTLHPTKFDHGTVLAQTPYPGIRHESTTVPELVALLAPMGAEMLVHGIRNGLFVPPLQDVALGRSGQEGDMLRPAPKIRSNDCHVLWHSWTAREIIRRHRVIGPLWNLVICKAAGNTRKKRIIWTNGFRPFTGELDAIPTVGRPILTGLHSKIQNIYIRTCDGQVLQADEVKVEGEGVSDFPHAAKRAGMIESPSALSDAPHGSALFHGELC